ncbi:MAG TPA: aminodeoxychorismate synthase component I [Gemmatimonadales bacterium]|nr:aminodeoxychorismate synthase component I [Gemmatimonadales bacterium]
MSDQVPLVEELTPVPDPLEACARLAGWPGLIFLDSAGDRSARGRFSFLTADPVAMVRSRRGTVELRLQAGSWTQARSDDPLAVARGLFGSPECEPCPGLPPFQGGVAGYIGYEWGAALEGVRAARLNDLDLPDAVLGCYDWVLAWDHGADRAWIVATGLPGEPEGRLRRAAARVRGVRARLALPPRAGPPRVQDTGVPIADSHPVPALGPSTRSTFTRDRYLTAVGRVVEHICAGDIFQANLSQRFQAPLVGSPFEFYGRLRARNPAPFSAYLAFEDAVVASASPERFLRLEDRRAEARPIKGTRPRGREYAADDALGAELATSVKDRAENAMIVDVVRNDLSRVCQPGSVWVPELFTVERYATVQHLVSTVVGELNDGCDVPDLLRAAFPSGSVTGAPKVRAMEIIAELEPTTRGVYCGAIGYWSLSGAFDASVAIRTCVLRAGRVFFHAGGGVTAQSDPTREYEETLDKARGIAAALE